MEIQGFAHQPFSTHKFIKQFVDAKNEEERGELIAETIVSIVTDIKHETSRQIEIDVERKTIDVKKDIKRDSKEFATKGDVRDLRDELKGDIASVRTELHQEISLVHQNMLQMENRMMHKMYMLTGSSIAVFITVTIGILPYILKH